MGAGIAQILQVALDRVHLILAVGLGGAVQQAHSLGVGEPGVQHLSLLVQGRQIGGAGDVVASGAGKAVNAQSHAVLGDGGAQNGNGAGAGGSGLESGGAVGHDQVHALGDKVVGNGGAVGGIAGGVLGVDGDTVAQQFRQGVLKALGGGVQGLVLDLLDNTHGVGLAAGGGLVAAGIGIGICGLGVAAAGSQAQSHDGGQRKGKKLLFHRRDLLFKIDRGEITKSGSVRRAEPPSIRGEIHRPPDLHWLLCL